MRIRLFRTLTNWRSILKILCAPRRPPSEGGGRRGGARRAALAARQRRGRAPQGHRPRAVSARLLQCRAAGRSRRTHCAARASRGDRARPPRHDADDRLLADGLVRAGHRTRRRRGRHDRSRHRGRRASRWRSRSSSAMRVAASPALAMVTTQIDNTFALYVNGRRRNPTTLPASSAADAADPFIKYARSAATAGRARATHVAARRQDRREAARRADRGAGRRQGDPRGQGARRADRPAKASIAPRSRSTCRAARYFEFTADESGAALGADRPRARHRRHRVLLHHADLALHREHEAADPRRPPRAGIALRHHMRTRRGTAAAATRTCSSTARPTTTRSRCCSASRPTPATCTRP